MNNKLAVITGASSGIGKEFAYQLHTLGYDLMLVARREGYLQKIADDLNQIRLNSVSYLKLDLVNSEDCEKLEVFISQSKVTLLVNNVGRGSYGYFEDISRGLESDMVLLNAIVPLRLSHSAIPYMKSIKEGGIIFISSVAGFQPLPYMSTYSATKAFNLHQSIALHRELKEFNIQVTVVCPGPVDTEFGGVARVPGTITGIKRELTKTVVRESINGFLNKKLIVIPGIRSKLMIFLLKIIPISISTFIVSRLISPKKLLG
jgi:short-subunit dehydrogenase